MRKGKGEAPGGAAAAEAAVAAVGEGVRVWSVIRREVDLE